MRWSRTRICSGYLRSVVEERESPRKISLRRKLKRRSAARKCGPRASPTTAAAARAWPKSKDAGGGDFYDRVYTAERPELFFKATASRVAGPGGNVRIRSDAKWSVPEPELTLLINPRGQIIGYTVGNDMSSRDIEGENPLYLPQAKVYDRSCALGPCILDRQRAASSHDADPHRDRARRHHAVFRRHDARRVEARARRPGGISFPREHFSVSAHFS